MKFHITRATLSLIVCGILASPLSAQSQNQSNRQSSHDQQSSQDQRSQKQDSSKKKQAKSKNQQSDQRQTETYLVPEGWVTIGVDTDNDNRVDVFRTIYAYDLYTATKKSDERRKGSQNRTWQDDNDSQRSMMNVQGTIEDKKTIQLSGHDENFVVAKVNTSNDEKRPVLLGTQQKLKQLDLQNGDRVEVSGQKGTINDRQMVIAMKVSSGGKTINTTPKTRQADQKDQSKKSNERQIRGSVENLQERKFKDQDETFYVADINLSQGPSRPIVLGPTSKIDQLNLESGDQISAVVCKGRLNGETALVAKEVTQSGQTVQIDTVPQKVKKESGKHNDSRNR